MRIRRPIALILSAALAAGALTGCDSFSGHAAAAANSAQVQQLIEFIADLSLERDLRQALQSGGDLRQALLTLLGLENAANFNVDGLTSARPGQHAVQVWEVTAQSAEDAAALAASQIRAVLEQLKSNGVTAGRIGMVEVDGKYYVVVDVEVTEENTFEPVKPVSDDDDGGEENSGSQDKTIIDGVTENASGLLTIDVAKLGLNEDDINAAAIIEEINTQAETQYNYNHIVELDLSGCQNLTIDNGAFLGCTSLQTVKMGNVNTIEQGAFSSCTGLQTVKMGNVNTIGQGAFSDCDNLQTVKIDNVNTIGQGAFSYCDNLRTVTMGNVDTIGDSAFRNCITLQTVTMGNLDTIEPYAFSDLRELQTVTMGDVNTIGRGAFSHCSKLQTVTMGDVNTIGQGAFNNCISLTNICFSNSAPPRTENYAFDGAGSSDQVTAINIYSNIENEADRTTVKGWFDQDVQAKVEFHPYSPGPQNLPTLPSLL